MFDSIGKTMEILSSETIGGKQFLPELFEETQGHGIQARYKDNVNESEYRVLTVEPIAIHGSIEIVEGGDIGNLENTPVFRKLIKLVDKVRNVYNINILNRSGLRLCLLGKIEGDSSLALFNSLIKKDFRTDVEKVLGAVTDSAVVLDGKHEDDTNYHASFGPYKSLEAKKFFPNTFKKMLEIEKFHVIADIDVYRNKFDLHSEVSYIKWCSPIFSKVEDTMKLFLDHCQQS
jgi:hypothetical protein